MKKYNINQYNIIIYYSHWSLIQLIKISTESQFGNGNTMPKTRRSTRQQAKDTKVAVDTYDEADNNIVNQEKSEKTGKSIDDKLR